MMRDASKNYLGLIKGLSEVEKRALREIIRADKVVSPNIFEDFFCVENRVSGYRGDGLFNFMLTDLVTVSEEEIMNIGHKLSQMGLVRVMLLTTWCFSLEREFVHCVNGNGPELLSALYSKEEREKPSPRLFRGIIWGEPRKGTYTDPDHVPLNGTFIADNDLFMEPGTYCFVNGKIVERID